MSTQTARKSQASFLATVSHTILIFSLTVCVPDLALGQGGGRRNGRQNKINEAIRSASAAGAFPSDPASKSFDQWVNEAVNVGKTNSNPVVIAGDKLTLHGKEYELEDWINPLTDKPEKAIKIFLPSRDEPYYVALSTARDVSGCVVVSDGNHRLLAAIALFKAGRMPGDKVLGETENGTFTVADAVKLYNEGRLISVNAPTGYSGFGVQDVVNKFENWSDNQREPIRLMNADPTSVLHSSLSEQRSLLSERTWLNGKNWWEADQLIKYLVEQANSKRTQ
jgi:hypothetical protein